MSKNYELLRRLEYKSEPPRVPRPGSLPSDARSRRFAHTFPIQSSQFEWRRVFNILQIHWRASASFAAVVFVIVTIVALTQKPVYEPRARIEIDPPGTELFSLASGGAASNDTEYIETQAKNLQSDELAIAVIRSLRLDQNHDVLSTSKVSPFSHLNLFGRFRERGKEPSAQVSERTANERQPSKTENIALRNFQSRLTVKRDTSSRLVNASFASHDPRLAALVTNTLVDLFIERSYKARHDAIMQSSEWLGKQLDDIRGTMNKSNADLAEYQKAWGIADLGEGERQSTLTEGVAELNRQLAQAQADRIQIETHVRSVQTGNAASLEQVGNDPVVQGLTQKLADARTELSQSMAVYGSKHPNVRRLQNQADELEAQLTAQRKAIVGRIHTSYAAAQAREKLVSREMKIAMDQAHRIGQYNMLKQKAQADRDLYNALYTRVKEAGISAESKSSNIRVVDRARILDSPTRPHRMLTIAVGVFVGLLGGAMIAIMKEKFNTTLLNLDDVKRSTGISTISIVPTFEYRNGSSPPALESDSTPLRSEENYRLAAPERFVWGRPRSPEAEALQGLHISIMLCQLGRPPQIIQIASPSPGEGKTTLAVNLAVALSRHSRTCLVDADLRKPGIADSFGLRPQQGLCEVLSGRAPLEAVVIRLPDLKNLSILPACALTGDPGQLFVTESLRETIRALRYQFQQVVIDSPPLIAYADGRAIAPLVDGLLLVGRYGFTTCEAMARTMELLTRVNAAPVIEVVLNAVAHTSLESRYRYQATT